ncbi:ABC-type bacteriocin/lantibiotic exporter with N-terminal double-glycine peptidase domain [Flammeovirgaceae bacterium 311]|nr:ABC-type bacteriocin/lantibiotic exporter with N-terminal double-glycine peptidase domain [Flammeovirgaceae bacterium 311]
MAQIGTTSIPPLTRFFRLLKVDRKLIGHIYLYAVVGGLVSLSLPLGIQAIINLLGSGRVSTSLAVLVLLVMLGMGLVGLLQVLQLTVSELLQQKVFTRTAFEFAYRIPRLKGDTQRSYYVPELINRFFDTLSVQKGLSKILLDFSSAALQAIFGLVLLSLYHPFFIMFSVLLVGLVVLIFRFTGPTGMVSSLTESKYKYAVVHWLEEMARTLETFKLAGTSPLPLERTDKLVSGYLEARSKHFSVLKFQYINLIGFKMLVAAGLLILGGKLVLEQQMNIGQFVAAEIIIILVLNSVEKLIMSMETIYDVLTALDKLGHVMDLPLENNSGSKLQNSFGAAGGMSVQMNGVSVKEADNRRYLLQNLNLNIEAGERICITGRRNSGKSLLLRIMAGLQEPSEGIMNYNGLPLNSLNLESLRQTLGANLEKHGVFAGTLLENITLGKEGIDFDTVQEMAEITGLNRLVQEMQDGYTTMLLPEGRHLPESAVHKILLTRSLINKPRLILLEEPFEALNFPDRNRLLKYLLDPAHPWTVVLSTTQPELAKQFKKVLVLHNGELLTVTNPARITEEAWYNEVFVS